MEPIETCLTATALNGTPELVFESDTLRIWKMGNYGYQSEVPVVNKDMKGDEVRLWSQDYISNQVVEAVLELTSRKRRPRMIDGLGPQYTKLATSKEGKHVPSIEEFISVVQKLDELIAEVNRLSGLVNDLMVARMADPTTVEPPEPTIHTWEEAFAHMKSSNGTNGIKWAKRTQKQIGICGGSFIHPDNSNCYIAYHDMTATDWVLL